MSVKEYTKLVNNNTIVCWWVIAITLCVSYTIRGAFLLNSLWYINILLGTILIPLLYCIEYNKKNNGTKSLKYHFTVGYLIFYTFVVLTSKCPLTFMFIFPMIILLLVYCDKMLVLGIFTYTVCLNIGHIAWKWQEIVENNHNSTIFDNMTFWEIQLVTLILTGIFTYKTAQLLRKRDDVMADMLEDLYTDDLTDIRNIRFMEDNMKKRFNWDKAYNLSIAFIDVDNFKNFNTIYGHSFGDKVLITAAQLMNECCKYVKGIYLIRVGGDEFIIIGVNKSEREFYKIVDEIRLKVQDCKIEFEGKDVGICISIGVAHKYNEVSCKSFMELYNMADTRNNIAKEHGKNIIITEG